MDDVACAHEVSVVIGRLPRPSGIAAGMTAGKRRGGYQLSTAVSIIAR